MKTAKTLNRSALLLYNAFTLLSMKICVTKKNNLWIHPKGLKMSSCREEREREKERKREREKESEREKEREHANENKKL